MIQLIPDTLLKLHDRALLKASLPALYLILYFIPLLCVITGLILNMFMLILIIIAILVPSSYIFYLLLRITIRKKRIEEEMPFLALILASSLNPIKVLSSLENESIFEGISKEVKRWQRWRAIKGLNLIDAAIYEANNGINLAYGDFFRRLKEIIEIGGSLEDLMSITLRKLRGKVERFNLIFDDMFSALQTSVFLVPALMIPLTIFIGNSAELIVVGTIIPLVSIMVLAAMIVSFRVGFISLGEAPKVFYTLSMSLPMFFILRSMGLRDYMSMGLSLLVVSIPAGIIAYKYTIDITQASSELIGFLNEAAEYALVIDTDMVSAISYLALRYRARSPVKGLFKVIIEHITKESLLKAIQKMKGIKSIVFPLEALRIASEYSVGSRMMFKFVKFLTEIHMLQEEVRKKGRMFLLLSIFIVAVYSTIMAISIELGLRPLKSMLKTIPDNTSLPILVNQTDIEFLKELIYCNVILISSIFPLVGGLFKGGALTSGVAYLPLFIVVALSIILLSDVHVLLNGIWRLVP